MTKGIGYGTSIATSTGSIAAVRSISGPGSEYNDVDTTTLDSSTNYRTFVPGLGDPGEVTLELAFSSTQLTHQILGTHHNQRTVSSYTITHGTTVWGTHSFTGYVKSLGQEIPLDDLVTMSVTFKVSGLPGFASTT